MLQQGIRCGVGVLGVRGRGEQRLHLAVVGIRQTGLHALQQLPVPQRPRTIHPRVGQFREAAHHLLVGHLPQLAEERLGGLVQRGDDLVAACGHALAVALDLGDEAGAGGGGVVDLVHVGAQVR